MGRNAIALVESAYAFASDDRTWLRNVTAAALPLLDAGLGLASFFYDLRRPSDEWLDEPISVRAHPDLARALVAVHCSRSEDERVRPYLDPAPARTSSEIYELESAGAAARSGEPGRREAAKLGFADYLRIKAHAGGFGCVIGAPLPRMSRVDRTMAARWAMLSAHVAAALRLRRAFAPVDAILDADGRTIHAEPDLTRSALEELRRAAATIDRARGRIRRSDADRALSIWTALLGGRWSLVDRFDGDGRRLWIARRNARGSRDPRGLTPRERAVAGALALGRSNKVAAIELGVAEGTVSAHVASLRVKLGARSRTDLVARLRAPAAARVTTMAMENDALVVVSEPHRERRECDVLTPAERAVAKAVADGASNADVARGRGTSTHTVIAQLQQIYRKLGVHSRVELERRIRD